jgi:hypothetical protein
MEGYRRQFAHEVDILQRTVEIAEWAIAEGVSLELINYADLLWNPHRVIASLERLLPCIADNTKDNRGYNPDYIPRLRQDHFPENMFKAIGSTASYGKTHPPTKWQLGGSSYDIEKSRCTKVTVEHAQVKGVPVTIPEPVTELLNEDLQFIKLLETNRMLEFKLAGCSVLGPVLSAFLFQDAA